MWVWKVKWVGKTRGTDGQSQPNENKIIIHNKIIIIKKSRQCKAEREWNTPYQSKDPSPTIPTYRQKEEKGEKE